MPGGHLWPVFPPLPPLPPNPLLLQFIFNQSLQAKQDLEKPVCRSPTCLLSPPQRAWPGRYGVKGGSLGPRQPSCPWPAEGAGRGPGLALAAWCGGQGAPTAGMEVEHSGLSDVTSPAEAHWSRVSLCPGEISGQSGPMPCIAGQAMSVLWHRREGRRGQVTQQREGAALRTLAVKGHLQSVLFCLSLVFQK